MILDKGIATFYRRPDSSGVGNIAADATVSYYSGYYGELRVGITRYYAAKQANDMIDMMIRIIRPPSTVMIKADDECVLVDGRRYRIIQIQYTQDSESGEDCDDISLERVSLKYGSN